MTSLVCKFIPLQDSLDGTVLPDREAVVVGRSEKYKITSIFCSRRQLLLEANYSSRSVTVTVVGASAAGVDGKTLSKGETATATNESIIEVVKDIIKYQIKFLDNPKRAQTFNEESGSKKRKSEMFIWEHLLNGEVLFCMTSDFDDNREKIASFDLDGTLISTKSGRVFPTDCDDWKIWHESVQHSLTELVNDGWKIIVFTNQASLSTPKGKLKIGLFKKKIENILTALKIPASVYISTNEGYYRKPAPGMWEQMQKRAPCENISPDSFYCGDAAGRPVNWKPGRKADFAVSDRLFAINIGVKFLTPEELFLKEEKIPYQIKFDPQVFEDAVESFQFIPPKEQEAIVLAGSPASGKSHFVRKYLSPAGYRFVSRDDLGTWQKCVTGLQKLLSEGKSVVVDNTNPDAASRQRYIEVCKKMNVPVRCFFMKTTLDRCLHNNKFRQITDPKHVMVAPAIIKNFHSNFEHPTSEEGFYEIITVPFTPDFFDPELKRIYFYHLLSK